MMQRIRQWLGIIWKPGLFSMLQAFLMALLASMLMSEDNLFILVTSPSLWLPKLLEHSAKPFVWLSAPVLMIFFWVLRTVWLTVKYLLMAVALVAIGFVIFIVAMNFSDELRRFTPDSRAEIKYGALTQVGFPTPRRVILEPVQPTPACRQIGCIRIKSRRMTPQPPFTPHLPVPGAGEQKQRQQILAE